MDWVILGIIAYGAYYFLVIRKKHSSTSEYDLSRFDELVDMRLNSIKIDGKFMYGQNEYDPILRLMIEWSTRLLEISRHDKQMRIEIMEDWLNYLEKTERLMSNHYLWLENDRDKEGDERHFAEQRKLALETQEIENRYASKLGENNTLEIQRLKDEIRRGLFLCKEEDLKLLLKGLFETHDVKDAEKLKLLRDILKKMQDEGEHTSFFEKNQTLLPILKDRLKL